MLNQVVLVGRLTHLDQKENEILEVVLAVSRAFKNENGEYDTDFIKCILKGSIASNTNEYCKKGDLVGIKGRIENNNQIIAEKVTFLSSNKENKE